jgi:hypothetical protein
MQEIIFVASELAIVTGDNKYEKPNKVIDAVLNRSGIVKKYIPKSKIEETLLNLDLDKLNVIKKELNLDINTNIKDLESFIKKNVMGASYDSNLSEEMSKKKVDDILKNMPELNKCLEKSVKQDLRMRRGNIKEDNNLDKTEKQCNIVITDRNSQMYSKVLYIDPDNKFRIIIRGKVDGMNEEYIVETKNRTKRLFNMIPNYEKVQLNAYMFMTGKMKSLHIECYNNEQNQKEYNFDEELWSKITNNIIDFTNKNIVCHLKVY